MRELINRIGLPMFVQIIIECWNEVFLLILISVLFIGIHQEKHNKSIVKPKIPMTNELITFFIAVLIYNLCDIMDISFGGKPTFYSYIIIRSGVFCYYTVGEFMTLFFLNILKTHIAEKNSMHKLKKTFFIVQLIQIPLLILLALTPFYEVLYKITDTNEYMRSWGYFIWQNVTIVSFSFIGFVIITNWQIIDPFFKKIVVTSIVFSIIGIIGNFFIQISFNNIMFTVNAIVLFIIYEQNKTEITVTTTSELAKTKMLLTESMLSLEQSKNQTLMAQIQSHFINNSLMALRSRCMKYPDIYESITNFSMYLRSHFEAIGDTKTISFEQEMNNIEAYLALEKQNYKDHLIVEYEIECDDFTIPILSVQPLVENAVRHGIGTYEQGGIVHINTYRKNGKIIIEVIDDGSGNNNITQQQKKRKGIGIENVRARLASMKGGKLEIITRENGTTARITIDENN